MELSNRIWQELDGGYKTAYDVSIPLSQLEEADTPEKIKEIWEELWSELHHQGDVGLASYLAVPQIVRIGIEKNLFDWNLLGLCSTIEQQRHLGDNPRLPVEFRDYYIQGLSNLRNFVVENLNNELEKTTYIIALSTIATCDGRIELGKAIMEMENEDLLKEFLEHF